MNIDKYDPELNIRQYIADCRSLISEQQAEINKHNMIIDSLTSSMVSNVKGLFMIWNEKMLKEAKLQQYQKHKKDRPMYEFIKEGILCNLFEEDERKNVKLKSITALGFDECVYFFRIIYKGVEFELDIPNIKRASKENLVRMHYGQYALSYAKSDSHFVQIATSYDLNDIKEAIKKFIEK